MLVTFLFNVAHLQMTTFSAFYRFFYSVYSFRISNLFILQKNTLLEEYQRHTIKYT